MSSNEEQKSSTETLTDPAEEPPITKKQKTEARAIDEYGNALQVLSSSNDKESPTEDIANDSTVDSRT